MGGGCHLRMKLRSKVLQKMDSCPYKIINDSVGSKAICCGILSITPSSLSLSFTSYILSCLSELVTSMSDNGHLFTICPVLPERIVMHKLYFVFLRQYLEYRRAELEVTIRMITLTEQKLRVKAVLRVFRFARLRAAAYS